MKRRPYRESVIVFTTVRLLAPFVLAFGLFITLHGATSPGGGFQGGAIMAAVVFMLAFAFGFYPTREWMGEGPVKVLVGGGLVLFGGVALASLALGGSVLDYAAYEAATGVPFKYWGELVEVAIGLVVSGALVGLFFLVWGGTRPKKTKARASRQASLDREEGEA